ncbi:autotransporter outer membrane beta-barrel domain-containing protein [Avibacterium sp. 20-132]|uniref:autotransporter outer membrane beta-barrel domain-containing protein n=1 Tax=Avibacterium sp. 20-132 TaxID=2911526 RepID=UPI0020267569|nr:autotransporter outer membrane beta-barrel domain-containing protein [Avibacterium sp. 20-132]URL04654.1 autotransporter outer membrane beta-barrel domain-containing protein [Avibacterium sp. 20-132]
MQRFSPKLTLGAILVACYSQANAIDLTCSNQYGCNIDTNIGSNQYFIYEPSFEISVERKLLSSGNFPTDTQEAVNLTVFGGNYKNRGVTTNRIRENGKEFAGVLFSIEPNALHNQITLKDGVSAILERYANESGVILSLYKGDRGVIEQGVTLTIGSSIEQLNDTPEAYGGTAIHLQEAEKLIVNGGKILLNSYGSEGISANNSTLKIDNLAILMNAAQTNAISNFGGINFEGNKLSITGNQDGQFAFDLAKEVENQITLNLTNSQISLNNKSNVLKLEGPTRGDEAKQLVSKITFKDNTISAGTFFHYITENARKDVIDLQINGGEVKTEQLININDQHIIDMTREEEPDAPEITNNLALKIQADQGAKLQGVSYINPNYEHGTVDLTLNGNSQWKFKGDSTLDNLSVNNSTVEFEPDSAFHTLTINKDLSGNGEFILNSDLASENADQIIVKGSVTGNHRLQVRNSRNEPKKENGKVILVKTNSGDGEFSLKDKPYVDAGIYRYELAKDNNNWVLAHKGKSTNTEEPQPQPSDEGERTFSQYANNVISIQQAARAYLYTQGEIVSNRVSFLHNTERLTGFWVQNSNNWSEVDSYQTLLANTSGFKQRNHLLTVGYDVHFVNQETSYYAGLYTGLGQGKIDFKKDYGSAKIKGNHIGVYGGMQWQNGLFLDTDYSYNRLRLSSDEVDKQSFNAHSLRLGTGIKLPMFTNWNVVPQASISATKFNGNTTYRSKLGAQFMGNFALSSVSLKPYAGVYWLNDFGSNDIVISQSKANIQSFGNRAQLELGAALKTVFGSFDVSLKNEMGSRYRENVQLNLGYSYQW